MVNSAAFNNSNNSLDLQRLMLARVQEKFESNIVVQLVKGSVVPYDIPKAPSSVPEPVKPEVETPEVETQEVEDEIFNQDKQTEKTDSKDKEPQDPATVTKEQLQSPIDIRL